MSSTHGSVDTLPWILVGFAARPWNWRERVANWQSAGRWEVNCQPLIFSGLRWPALVWGGLVVFAVWSGTPRDAGAGQGAGRAENAQPLKERAEKLFESGKYAEALECYGKLKMFPRFSSSALIGSARCHQKLSDHEPALQALDAVIAREPRNAEAHYYRGHSYFAKKEFDKALADYSASIEAAPKVVRYYYARAAAYFGLADFTRSLADYNTMLQLEPRNASAFTSRGLVYHKLTQFDRALSDFSTALEMDPGYVLAFVARAQTYIQIRKWQLALDDLEAYSEKHPKDFDQLLVRAMLHAKLGEFADAIRRLTQAIGIHENAVKPRLLRADYYCLIGEFRSAVRDYERVAQIADGLRPIANSRLALFYATCPDKQLRDHDAALKHATACCELTKRKKWQALAVLAVVHQKAGRLEDANRCKEEALRVAPANEKQQARETIETRFRLDGQPVPTLTAPKRGLAYSAASFGGTPYTLRVHQLIPNWTPNFTWSVGASGHTVNPIFVDGFPLISGNSALKKYLLFPQFS